jgi:hypothetical protein
VCWNVGRNKAQEKDCQYNIPYDNVASEYPDFHEQLLLILFQIIASVLLVPLGTLSLVNVRLDLIVNEMSYRFWFVG